MKKRIRSFDSAVEASVTRLPRRLRPIMTLFTWLGEPVVTVGIATAVLGYGLALNKTFYITSGVIAVITIFVGAILKLILRRSRPLTEYVEQMFFKTFSFPSGHAAGSLVSYGLAAYVIGIKFPLLEAPVWIFAAIAVFFISLSRVYLGAHYASDIIGGWIVGGIGLALILLNGQSW